MDQKEESSGRFSGTFPDLFLDGEGARRILEAARFARRLEVSFDLHLSAAEVEILGDSFLYRGRAFSFVPLEVMSRRPRRVYRFAGAGRESLASDWEPLEILAGAYHQLVSAGRGAPTVEIGGIQMHRTSGTDPFTSAGDMAAACVRAGDRVLDTCGGLGYTAIHAARLGAVEVFSAEVSEGVIFLRRQNPWSRLEQGLPIRLVEGDVFSALAPLPAGSFDAVIHDPPRYSLAPELYSDAFYLRLFDLLMPGARLFHYTGEPYSRGRGRDFLGGVASRLRRAGFSVEPRADLQGFLCERRRASRPAERRG